MDRETQSCLPRPRIHIAKQFRCGPSFVASQADANNAVADLAEREAFIEYAVSRLCAEVANGVENPIQRHAEVALAAFASAFQAFKQRSELAAAPVNHSDRDVHLRV